MKNKIGILVLVVGFFAMQLQPALAVKFKDEGLSKGEVINLANVFEESEIHADLSNANFWFNNTAGGANGYHNILDYRIEAHTPIYRLGAHKGSLVTRIAGDGTFGHPARADFWDDPLIDIPELFWQDDFELGGHDARFAFGKFANRRFFDKDEIAPDPFDIGERPFFGSIANTNSLLNSINQGRDSDNINAIRATGSYGFMAEIKDNDGDSFTDGWGLRQGFMVARMRAFADNFYGISEINKSWGDVKPGKFTAGFLYAKDDVFRVPELAGDGNNAYLFYSSWVQKWHSRFTSYIRYGLLNNSDSTNADFSQNHITAGIITKLTSKDIVGNHIAWFQSRTTTSPVINLNFWIHKFTKHIYSTVFNIYRYGVPNATTLDGEDNNYFIGVGLTAWI